MEEVPVRHVAIILELQTDATPYKIEWWLKDGIGKSLAEMTWETGTGCKVLAICVGGIGDEANGPR